MKEEATSLDLPSPSLAIINYYDDDDDDFITFCSINKGKDVKKSIPEGIRYKQFQLGCASWVIVWYCEEEEEDYDNIEFQHFLWNPVTMEDPIQFPILDLDLETEIKYRLLTAPPDNPDCMLILFVRREGENQSFIYCKVGSDDWTEQFIGDGYVNCRLKDPVMCNGKIYCTCYEGGREGIACLAVIDIKSDSLQLNLLGPLPKVQYVAFWNSNHHLIESCGELFLIYEHYNLRVGDFQSEVCALDLYKLHSQGEWQIVESFEDRAFFVGPTSKFSYPAVGSVKGNHVYITKFRDSTVYAFDTKAQTIGISLPGTDIVNERTCFWLVTDLRSASSQLQKESECGEEKAVVTYVKGNGSSELPLFSSLHHGKLPSDLLIEIGSHLELRDYMNFRAVNTVFKEAAPLDGWKRSAFENYKENIPSPPMLISWRMKRNMWKLIDPIHKEKHFVTHNNNEFEEARVCYSKNGWCVIKHEKSVLLWNPFAKKIIPLPNLPSPTHNFTGCSFSSSPDSPESDCKIILVFNDVYQYNICSIKLGCDKWKSRWFDFVLEKPPSRWYEVATDNCLVLLKGTFYYLNGKGALGVYVTEDEVKDEDTCHVLNHGIKSPCEFFHQKFLLESDGNLLSVFVDFLGQTVQVFKLEESKMTWSSVENLGNNTIYLSRFSAFSTTAPSGMQNRIYFSRYCDEKSVIYYSLELRSLHAHNTGKILENFYDTKEQALCGWITPTF